MKNQNNRFLNLLKSIFIGLIIGIIILQFTGIAFVKGNSMNPTLDENSILILNKFAYKDTIPQRKDIILFKTNLSSSDNKNRVFVKRVIAIPGDHIVIEGKNVYINNQLLNESYIIGNTLGNIDMVIPQSKVFVMGDNRPNSTDSRDKRVGLIPKEDIIAKIINY